MKTIWFAKRCGKEILRDKLTIFFGIGFPVIIFLLLSIINKNVPAEAEMTLFKPEMLTPGISVFGLSFLALFASMLIAKDRESALMMRLLVSPLTASDFIFGYVMPLVPMALAQTTVCYLLALGMGLQPSWRILLAILFNLPMALICIALGLLCGTLLGSKQAGSLCGALLTNFSAWLSGAWFDLALVGGVFEGIAEALPFIHAVRLGRSILAGSLKDAFGDLFVVLGYAAVLLLTAIVIFVRRMKKGKIL